MLGNVVFLMTMYYENLARGIMDINSFLLYI